MSNNSEEAEMIRRVIVLFLMISGAQAFMPMQAQAGTMTASPTGAAAKPRESPSTPQPIDDGPPPPAGKLTVDGSVTLVSDYRYRGLSYTDNRPAVQGFLTISHASGLYVATFLSNLGGDGSYGGDDVEADILAGYARSVDDLTLDVGIWNYRFPGTRRTSFMELYGALTIPLSGAKAKTGFYYAPRQHAIGGHDDLSSYVDIFFPVAKTPVAIKTHAGYTVGKGATLAGPSGRYIDWSVGADIRRDAVTFNVSYVNTTINRARADRYYAVSGRRAIGGAMIVSVATAF